MRDKFPAAKNPRLRRLTWGRWTPCPARGCEAWRRSTVQQARRTDPLASACRRKETGGQEEQLFWSACRHTGAMTTTMATVTRKALELWHERERSFETRSHGPSGPVYERAAPCRRVQPGSSVDQTGPRSSKTEPAGVSSLAEPGRGPSFPVRSPDGRPSPFSSYRNAQVRS